MKKSLFLALMMVPLLSIAQDDLYFTRKDRTTKEQQTATTQRRLAVSTAPVKVEDYGSCRRDDDDYNRRYMTHGDWQAAGGNVPDSLLDDSIADKKVKKHDMNDSEDDYRYSRRLLRFHSPRFYAMSSPYYWDLVYGYGIYDYWYDDYWFYDPFFYDWGWTYGWAGGMWNYWYGPMWGYHGYYGYYHPYHHGYWDGFYYGWSYGISMGHPNHDPSFASHRTYESRSAVGRTGYAGGGRRTNPTATTNGRTSSFSQTRGGGTSSRGRSYSTYSSRITNSIDNSNYERSTNSNSRYTSRGRSTATANRGDYNAASRSSYQRSNTTTNSTYSRSNSTSRTTTTSRANTSTYTPPTTYSSSSSSGGGFSSGGGGSRGGGGGGGGSRGGGGRR